MKMHGETIKIIDAQQTKYYNIYKNLLKRLSLNMNTQLSSGRP